jgi:hypothetical protein
MNKKTWLEGCAVGKRCAWLALSISWLAIGPFISSWRLRHSDGHLYFQHSGGSQAQDQPRLYRKTLSPKKKKKNKQNEKFLEDKWQQFGGLGFFFKPFPCCISMFHEHRTSEWSFHIGLIGHNLHVSKKAFGSVMNI